MPHTNPYYNSPYTGNLRGADIEKRIKEDPIGTMLESFDPAGAARWRRQREAALSGRPYAQMRAYRAPKTPPPISQRVKTRAEQLGRAIIKPTARNNIFSPIVNPFVDYVYGQTKAGKAEKKVLTRRGRVTPQDLAAMQNAANMSTGKALKTLVEGTPVFRQAAWVGDRWARLAYDLSGMADAGWSLTTGAPMNDKGKRQLARFGSSPWLTSLTSLEPRSMLSNYISSQINNYRVANQYQRQMRAAAEQPDPQKRYQMQLNAMNDNYWRLHFIPDQYTAYLPSLIKYPEDTIKKVTDPDAHTQSPYPTYFWHFNTMVPTRGDREAFLKHSDTPGNLNKFMADQRKRQDERGVPETNVWETPQASINKALYALHFLGGKGVTQGILPVVTQEQVAPALSGYRQFYTKLNTIMDKYNAQVKAPGTQPVVQARVSKFPRGTARSFYNVNPYSTYIARTGASMQKLKDKLNSGQLTAEEQYKLRIELVKLQAAYKQLEQKTKGQIEARNTVARLMPGYLLGTKPTRSVQNLGRLFNWYYDPAYDENREQALKNITNRFDWFEQALPKYLFQK